MYKTGRVETEGDITMKTKYWIGLFALVLAVCAGLSVMLFMPGEEASYAEITSGGKLVRSVDLRVDQEFTVDGENGGYNLISVKSGKIGVIEATCPDHYCMHRGMISSGAQIVCLPNRLVITLIEENSIDGISG